MGKKQKTRSPSSERPAGGGKASRPKKTEEEKRAAAIKKITKIQAWARDGGMPSQGLLLMHLQTLAAYKSQFGGGSVGEQAMWRSLRVFNGKVYPVRLYSDPPFLSIATLNTLDFVDALLVTNGDLPFSQLEATHGELFGTPFTEFMESNFLAFLITHKYVITPVEDDYVISPRPSSLAAAQAARGAAEKAAEKAHTAQPPSNLRSTAAVLSTALSSLATALSSQPSAPPVPAPPSVPPPPSAPPPPFTPPRASPVANGTYSEDYATPQSDEATTDSRRGEEARKRKPEDEPI